MLAPMPGVSLFVYGTLTEESRLESLTGRRFPRRPARLDGYERIEGAAGRYPYLAARPGACADGFLVEDIDPASLRALDAYEDEGRLYVRRRVEVTAEGRRVACETYVGAAIGEAPARARTRDRASRG